MSRVRVGGGVGRVLGCAVGAVVLALVVPAPALPRPDDAKDEAKPKDNSNALLKEYRDKVKVGASTFWPGWAPEKVIDGDPLTSWFTAGGDAVAKGTKPWIELELPQDETVRRVTVLGNREPAWPTGFSVLSGSLELLDKDRKRLWYKEDEGAGKLRDFDFNPKKAVKGVRYIRFTSLGDEGDKTAFEDIAVGEIQVE